MPTAFRHKGHRVVIYTDDHEPPHVHVHLAGCEAVFALNCPNGPLELRERQGFTLRETRQIEKWLTAQIEDLCRQWEEIHGDE